ncbi:Unknown protein [Striga hermonthica]|uniref:Uncharacterized protein n=1 Tax=Striga hermonthica TaxID=68872 RepID=A0A9N7NWJ5_STRHE|nr:Unknown protein [Striga hermonthica]
MASVSSLSSPNIPSFCRKPISKNLVLRPFEVDFPWCRARTSAIKTHSDGAGPTSNGGADLLRWPASSDPGGDDDPADEAGEKKGGDEHAQARPTTTPDTTSASTKQGAQNRQAMPAPNQRAAREDAAAVQFHLRSATNKVDLSLHTAIAVEHSQFGSKMGGTR